MAYEILILGASYGSLLGTKLLMAGHNVTLVCRSSTAELINAEGTEVRMRMKGENEFRQIMSNDQPGHLWAVPPNAVDPSGFDMAILAMQEPQYETQDIWRLLKRIAERKIPCLSIMNMPPLPYLKRFEALDAEQLEDCYSNPRVWDNFEPGLFSLCSPDPQAVRLEPSRPNLLQVNLPTNFKAAVFADSDADVMLRNIEADIDAVHLGGVDVPVKLRVYDSLYVPLAKWSMLLTGNYRCLRSHGVRSIKDAVHENLQQSQEIYHFVDELVQRLGAQLEDQVPFSKYAKAAENLVNPSSVARAIGAGASKIERVDRLVQAIAKSFGLQHDAVDQTVRIVDQALAENRRPSP